MSILCQLYANKPIRICKNFLEHGFSSPLPSEHCLKKLPFWMGGAFCGNKLIILILTIFCPTTNFNQPPTVWSTKAASLWWSISPANTSALLMPYFPPLTLSLFHSFGRDGIFFSAQKLLRPVAETLSFRPRRPLRVAACGPWNLEHHDGEHSWR